GIPLNNLISWNKLKSRTIYPGQQLIVADPSATISNPGTSLRLLQQNQLLLQHLLKRNQLKPLYLQLW
ncbi:LysM peptidoglycan-binding domain-containing protein, partial [Mesobacillus boroniphilus]|uniref:LysM peptidoglycan-binding domain-containing protein n=1 Tax=Mesobacillus boroniphilus TaxID=308892 RepID=UPI00054E31BC